MLSLGYFFTSVLTKSPMKSHSKLLVVVALVWGAHTRLHAQTCVQPFNPPDANGYSTLNPVYFDTDANGVVGVDDLMNVLSVYGETAIDDGSFICGDRLNYQGYEYATVLVGGQCFFAENLRSKNYQNGDPLISSFVTDQDWVDLTSGATAAYYVSNACEVGNQYHLEELAYETAYGRVYNYYAVNDSRNLCPSGWHVPSFWDWQALIGFLGGEAVAGGKLKTTYGWADNNNGSNDHGFRALPGGWRLNFGQFYNGGTNAYFWSSSADANGPVGYLMGGGYAANDENWIYSAFLTNWAGLSVRCMKD